MKKADLKALEQPGKTEMIKVIQIELGTAAQIVALLEDPKAWTVSNMGEVIRTLRSAQPVEIEVPVEG